MIGKFLQWLNTGRHASTKCSAGRSLRRLAVEPIEDRLLLSAAGTDTVSDGGTIVLNQFDSLGYFWAQVDRPVVVATTPDGDTAGQHDSESLYKASSSDGHLAITGGLSGRPNNLTTIQPEYQKRYSESSDYVSGIQDSVETGNSFLDSSNTTLGIPNSVVTDVQSRPDQVAPTPKPVARDDLDTTPSDSGMVDLTYAAYDQVFAEIGTAEGDLVARDDLQGMWRTGEAGSTSPQASFASFRGEQPLHGSTVLAGSRGRLATFDLAIARQSVPDPRVQLEELDASIDGTDIPTSSSVNSEPIPMTPAAFSRVEPGTALPPERSQDDSVARLVSLELLDSQVADNVCKLRQAELRAHENGLPQESCSEESARGRVAYLDERRDKPVVHLAVAMGLGYALMGRRDEPRDEHEQLPPKKRN